MTNRKDIVQRINEGFAEHNLEKVLPFCTDDLTWTMVGDTTTRGKDSIRKWMASMNPQPPRFTIQQTVAEGDVVITRGDMLMQEKKNGPSIPYTFCDIYRFEGDKVAQLTSFVIRTERPAGATGRGTSRGRWPAPRTAERGASDRRGRLGSDGGRCVRKRITSGRCRHRERHAGGVARAFQVRVEKLDRECRSRVNVLRPTSDSIDGNRSMGI